MSGLLLVLSGSWPWLGSHAGSGLSAGILLVSGALIGIPHGASDFPVAHRLLKRVLGRAWLVVFVLAYLTLVLAVLLAWWLAPLATLIVFLAISSLHFGGEDLEAYDEPPTLLRWLARVSTPLVPIVALHLSDVTPFFATLSGRDVGSIMAALQPWRMPVLGAWLVFVGTTVLCGLADLTQHPQRGVESCELLALAIAAAILPPLVTFAVYFCLIHAVRHLVGLTAGFHPNDGLRALRLSTFVVLPSAAACVVLLASCWSMIAGVMTTDRLLCAALQLVAALTVPHMVLEALDRSSWMTPSPMTRPGGSARSISRKC